MNSKRRSLPRVVLVTRCFIRDESGRILLVRRSESDRHHSELWEVPGGKLEAGQDLAQATEREILEETGLVVTPISRLSYVESRVLGHGPYRGLPYVAIFSLGKIKGGALYLSDEHDKWVWVEAPEARRLSLTPGTREALSVLAERLQ